MFNKLKQFKDLRNQAKTMQNALAGESVTIDKNGVKITMNGNLEITAVEITSETPKTTVEKAVLNNTNDAIKKVQKIMATKMQEMGGFPGFGA
jgi:DNA-binding protein YbaB